MEKKVNLRGMIHLDQVEDLLSNLVDTVNAQQKEIEDLKCLCENFLSNRIAEEMFRDADYKMKNLENRLHQVHVRSTSIVDGNELSSGELAAYNNLKINEINAMLETVATRTELHDVAQTIIGQHQSDIKAIREWASPLDVTRMLESSQKDTTTRITGIEAVVSCKLDRSELRHIEALASRLMLYEEFKNETKSSLETLDLSFQDLLSRALRHKLEIDSSSDKLDSVAVEIRTLASKGETRALARELENHAAALSLCARVEVVDKIEDIVAGIDRKVLEGKNHSLLIEKAASVTKSELLGKASVGDVHACVRRKHYDEAVTALGSAIDEKAASRSLHLCESRVGALEGELASQNERLSIVTRFVEWFTSRGENYEHNIKIIDKHLGDLTNNAVNRMDKLPYRGHIKFSSVLGDNAREGSSY